MKRFRDRAEAGQQLAKALGAFAKTNGIVLALPRGGVPVAFEVCKALKLPLDLLVVRKLGVPGHEELAMGAIAAGGGRFINTEIVEGLKISVGEQEAAEAAQGSELGRRERAYRGGRSFPNLEGRTVILIDDGIATGATLRAAIASVKAHHPAKLIVAVPVAPPETVQELQQEVDQVICLLQPPHFEAVGQWYESFPQTSDAEVLELLKAAQQLVG